MTVQRFQCASGDRLAQVLAGDLAVPYRAHRKRIGQRIYDRWAAERGAQLLCNATGAFETPTGAIGWKTLAWDSKLFGFPAARIDVLAVSGGYTEARDTSSKLIEKAVEETTSASIRHLVARIDASCLAYGHALAENGFELIDGTQTFAFDCSVGHASDCNLLQADPGDGTRLATPADTDQIAEIARSSFVCDRFHTDVSIESEAANRIHETWARNSVNGEVADAVLVSASQSAVHAFVTVKIDLSAASSLGLRVASIPLVATACQARGQGAARRAIEAAIAWCRSQQVDIVEVGTQISNTPAARLYQSAAFRTTAISLTYRKLID